MNIMRSVLVIFMLTIVAACNTMPKTTIRSHANVKNIIKKQSDFAVLPADVVVNMVDVGNRKTRVHDYEYQLEDLIKQEIVSALKEKGYKASILHRRDIHEKNISHETVTTRQIYNKEQSKLYSVYLMPENDAYNIKNNIGDSPIKLAKTTGTEVFVMVNYFSDVKTTGARGRDLVMDLLIGTRASAIADGAVLYIGFVDSATGDILWANGTLDAKDIYISAFDNLSSDKEVDLKRIRRMINRILEKFPSSNGELKSA